jgi:curved DNA-binding protein CbpA
MTISQARTVLGMPENFTLADLKSQYRKKVLIAHPDRNGGDDSKFIIVQRAFELLTAHKENSTIYYQHTKQSPRYTHANKVYQQRRQAEQAYKEKVHYTTRRRRAKKPPKTESFDDLKTNLKYFVFTALSLSSFFILLLISIRFGAFGILFFLIIFATLFSRIDFRKIKL